jgi:hypothetical protein
VNITMIPTGMLTRIATLVMATRSSRGILPCGSARGQSGSRARRRSCDRERHGEREEQVAIVYADHGGGRSAGAHAFAPKVRRTRAERIQYANHASVTAKPLDP